MPRRRRVIVSDRDVSSRPRVADLKLGGQTEVERISDVDYRVHEKADSVQRAHADFPNQDRLCLPGKFHLALLHIF